MNIYHITPFKNTYQIIKEGIKSNNEGNIFVFTNMLVSNQIAKTQIFTMRYSVLKINRKGITGKILKDNVGEFTASFHRIIKQDHIDSKFLTLVCVKETVMNKPTMWDYSLNARLKGWTCDQTNKFFAIDNWWNDQTKKGELSGDEILEEVNRRLSLI